MSCEQKMVLSGGKLPARFKTLLDTHTHVDIATLGLPVASIREFCPPPSAVA